MRGELLGIFITEQKSQPMTSLTSALAIEGVGMKGDRYTSEVGTFSKSRRVDRHITLIEYEAVQALQRDYEIVVDPKELRRNLLTKNIALNHFVGRKLVIGDVVVEGVELCEPCGYLSEMLKLPLKEALKHRGGLRCRIVTGGELVVGQTILSVD